MNMNVEKIDGNKEAPAAKKPLEKNFRLERQNANLACFVAKPTILLSIVRDRGFRKFISNLNTNYKVL